MIHTHSDDWLYINNIKLLTGSLLIKLVAMNSAKNIEIERENLWGT